MRPQPKKARDALIEALDALQDPKALCKQRGHSEDYAYAYAAGVAKSCIEQALHALGEPIELYRPLGVPYHRAGSGSQLNGNP